MNLLLHISGFVADRIFNRSFTCREFTADGCKKDKSDLYPESISFPADDVFLIKAVPDKRRDSIVPGQPYLYIPGSDTVLSCLGIHFCQTDIGCQIGQ